MIKRNFKKYRGHMLLVILTVNKLLGRFKKKNPQKLNQKNFRVEKVLKESAITIR